MYDSNTDPNRREFYPFSSFYRTSNDRTASDSSNTSFEWPGPANPYAYTRASLPPMFSAAARSSSTFCDAPFYSSKPDPFASHLLEFEQVPGAYPYASSSSSSGSIVTPGTPRRRLAESQMILSPSPPSQNNAALLLSEFSPQIRDLTGTLFVDRFLPSFLSDWDIPKANNDSPVVRNTSPNSPIGSRGLRQTTHGTKQALGKLGDEFNPFLDIQETDAKFSNLERILGSSNDSYRNFNPFADIINTCTGGSLSPSTLTPLSSPGRSETNYSSKYVPKMPLETNHRYPTRSRTRLGGKVHKNSNMSPRRWDVIIRPSDTGPKTRRKDLKTTSSTEQLHAPSIFRTFPPDLQPNARFPLFYRRFPASSYFQLDDESFLDFSMKSPGGTYNLPRDPFDLYTPRFVKGKGRTKVGLCPICVENGSRGGEGQKLWLSMKFSAFNYHMQYSHGISAMTARPFSPPTAFQVVVRRSPGRLERTEMLEGKCHKCSKWIPVEGVKEVDVKVKEIFWWKHAAICHQGSTLFGENNHFLDDSVYHRLKQLDA